MSNFLDTLKSLAPTVATALGGPLAGAAVSALGSVFGVPQPTQAALAKVIENTQLTPDHIAEIKKLELQYQAAEAERGFKYAELAFKNQDSARTSNVTGGVQHELFGLSVILLIISLGTEIWVLFHGYTDALPEIIVGRVLGLLDAIAMMVMGYWYGTSSGSRSKDALLANSNPVDSAKG